MRMNQMIEEMVTTCENLKKANDDKIINGGPQESALLGGLGFHVDRMTISLGSSVS